jgi:hypothetical protein
VEVEEFEGGDEPLAGVAQVLDLDRVELAAGEVKGAIVVFEGGDEGGKGVLEGAAAEAMGGCHGCLR